MVHIRKIIYEEREKLSVLALSSRFDGLMYGASWNSPVFLSVLALSSRFDGPCSFMRFMLLSRSFSTRSVESF